MRRRGHALDPANTPATAAQCRQAGGRGAPAARASSELAPDRQRIAPQLGDMLARMHLAGARLPAQPAQPARPRLVERHRAGGAAATSTSRRPRCCASELAYQNHVAASSAYAALPRGAVHADLFRDNVMFDAEPGRRAAADRLVRFLLRRRRHLAVRPRGVPERLVPSTCDSGRTTTPRAAALLARLRRACAPLRPPSARCCPPCCAPPRCASGSRACGTSTCRARRRMLQAPRPAPFRARAARARRAALASRLDAQPPRGRA